MILLKRFSFLAVTVAFLMAIASSAYAAKDKAAIACEGYEYTKCPTGYEETATCQDGKVKKYKCEACSRGFIKYNGKCVKPLKCKNGGRLNGTICECTAEWTGATCNVPAKCPYKQTKCSTGFYATGNTCKSGRKIVIECVPNKCEGFNYTRCPRGYAKSDTCQSGTIKKYKCDLCANSYLRYNNLCVKRLKCKNGGKQFGTMCDCPDGWTGNLCQTKHECPYTTTSCTEGYEETGETCKTSSVTYKKCREKSCKGYKRNCGKGETAEPACLSGTTQYYTCTPKGFPSDFKHFY